MSGAEKRVKADQPDDEEAIIQALEQVETIQDKLESLNDEASERVLEVEKEYNRLRRPHYRERSALLRKIPGFWSKVVCW